MNLRFVFNVGLCCLVVRHQRPTTVETIIRGVWPPQSMRAAGISSTTMTLTPRAFGAKQTDFSYDAKNRLTQKIDTGDAITAYAYDSIDRNTSITDALDKKTEFTYNNKSQLSQVKDPRGNLTRIESIRSFKESLKPVDIIKLHTVTYLR